MHIGSLATGTALPGRFDASLVVYSSGKPLSIILLYVEYSTRPSVILHAKLNNAHGQALKVEYNMYTAFVKP